MAVGLPEKPPAEAKPGTSPKSDWGYLERGVTGPPKVAVLMFIKGSNKSGFLKHLRNDAFPYVRKDVSIMKLLLGTRGQ